MSLETNKCSNCGGELSENNGEIVCVHCGSNYGKKPKSAQEEYIETLMAACILNATTSKSKSRQNKHLYQARDEFYNGNYADCRVHLNRALEIDPGNADANLMKSLLTKGENGRYVSPPSYKYVNAIKSWLNNEYYKETSYIDSVFLSYLPSIFISLRKVYKLIDLFEASQLENKDEFLEILNKRRRAKIIAKCILWPIIILLLALTINDCSKKSEEKNMITMTYQAASGGGIYIPSEKKYYYSYTYTVSKGSNTVATAQSYDGYKFWKWSDGCTYISRKDTVRSNFSVTAYFVKDNSVTEQNGEVVSETVTIDKIENRRVQKEMQTKINEMDIAIAPRVKCEFVDRNRAYVNNFSEDSNFELVMSIDGIFENLFFDWKRCKESGFFCSFLFLQKCS